MLQEPHLIPQPSQGMGVQSQLQMKPGRSTRASNGFEVRSFIMVICSYYNFELALKCVTLTITVVKLHCNTTMLHQVQSDSNDKQATTNNLTG